VSAYLQRPDICSAHIVHIKVNGICWRKLKFAFQCNDIPTCVYSGEGKRERRFRRSLLGT
jgi:hypothetical protein